MNKKTIKHHIEGLMALLMFGIFTVCVLAVLLMGADAYRRLTERDQAVYNSRTCMQYIATRVRQADALDSVSVEEFGGVDCLILTEHVEGEEYVTLVYCYDGAIRELYATAGTELEPESGEKVMEAEEMSLQLRDGRLIIKVTTADGGRNDLLLTLRSGEVSP